MLSFVILLVTIGVALATVGIDVSQRTYVSNFQCFLNYGYNFAIVRVYQSFGSPDPNGPATINDAWNAGMAHVDGYIFPCYSCGNPAGQMDQTIDFLASHKISMMKEGELRENVKSNSTVGASVGMLWLDVEGTQYWSGSPSANVNFLSAMVQRGRERGVNLGIYSSASQWNPIMGGSAAFSNLPLWYAHYDYDPSYNDWYSFGGWSRPAIKQYAGDQYFCNAGVDKNYY